MCQAPRWALEVWGAPDRLLLLASTRGRKTPNEGTDRMIANSDHPIQKTKQGDLMEDHGEVPFQRVARNGFCEQDLNG